MPAPSDKPKSKAATAAAETEKAKPAKPAVALEEDDEFEDFPAEPWEDAAAELGTLTQWEDNWGDDDEAEDFSVQLKIEEKKKASGVAPMKH